MERVRLLRADRLTEARACCPRRGRGAVAPASV